MPKHLKAVALAASLLFAQSAFAAALARPQPTPGRLVRCSVKSEGSRAYVGQCRFHSEGGGSFTLDPARGRFLTATVTSVTVYLTGRAAAEVSGLTSEGVNSRWGEAKRSRKDLACWTGADFEICAH